MEKSLKQTNELKLLGFPIPQADQTFIGEKGYHDITQAKEPLASITVS